MSQSRGRSIPVYTLYREHAGVRSALEEVRREPPVGQAISRGNAQRILGGWLWPTRGASRSLRVKAFRLGYRPELLCEPQRAARGGLGIGKPTRYHAMVGPSLDP